MDSIGLDMFEVFCDRKASAGLKASAGAVILLRGKEAKCKCDLISSELIKVAEMRR